VGARRAVRGPVRKKGAPRGLRPHRLRRDSRCGRSRASADNRRWSDLGHRGAIFVSLSAQNVSLRAGSWVPRAVFYEIGSPAWTPRFGAALEEPGKRKQQGARVIVSRFVSRRTIFASRSAAAARICPHTISRHGGFVRQLPAIDFVHVRDGESPGFYPSIRLAYSRNRDRRRGLGNPAPDLFARPLRMGRHQLGPSSSRASLILPSNSGLGSSSSFTVALLKRALHLQARVSCRRSVLGAGGLASSRWSGWGEPVGKAGPIPSPRFGNVTGRLTIAPDGTGGQAGNPFPVRPEVLEELQNNLLVMLLRRRTSRQA